MKLKPDAATLGMWTNPDWQPGAPGTFAIVIGVSRYDFLDTRPQAPATYGLGQLQVSALTAYRFFRWLEERYIYDGSPLARCWLLLAPTDAEAARIAQEEGASPRDPPLLDHVLRPTLDNCERAINSWFGVMSGQRIQEAAPASRAFFFFSGHGLEISSDQQILLPCDYLDPAFNKNPDRALSTHNLFAGLAALPVPHQFFFLDACRNDARELRELQPSGRAILSEPPAYRANQQRIAPLFYASASGAQSWQAPDLSRGLSLFGQALLDGLQAQAGFVPDCSGGPCAVGIFDLMPFLQRRVNGLLLEYHARVRQPVRLSGSVADVPITFVPGYEKGVSFGIGKPATSPSELEFVEMRDAAVLGENTPAAFDAEQIFDGEYLRQVWRSIRVYGLLKSVWLPSPAYQVHRAARASDRAYRIELSIPESKGNYWIELSEDAALAGATKFACLLPAAEDGTTHYTIELALGEDSRLAQVEAGLALDNPGSLGQAAALWQAYQALELAAAATGAEALRSGEAMLKNSVQSSVAAAVAGLVLLRARRLGGVELREWLSNLASWFPDLPDGPVLLAEQLLREAPGEPPADLIDLLLLLRVRGLPTTADALSYAAAQAEDLIKSLRDDHPQRSGLELVAQKLHNALRYFRSGGLFSVFAGPPRELTPTIVEGDPIAQWLGQSQPPSAAQRAIVAEIRARAAGPPDGIFGPRGLCRGYPLAPLTDRYFVAQEFSARGDDLRSALSRALDAYGRPIGAGDNIQPGHLLCKISALIQSTRFGVYALPEAQDRNVYLQLGIALGLGRPYVLVRHKNAALPPLIEGLDFYQMTSLRALERQLGQMVNIIDYQPPDLTPAGAEATAVIAHGDLDVVDFCVTAAARLNEHGFTPVILGDGVASGEVQPGELEDFLSEERIAHHIVGGAGRARIDETIATIQSARLGVYRVDEQAAPDAFLALGVALGLNRPGLLLHDAHHPPPTNLRGLGMRAFAGFTSLAQVIPADFLQRYRP